MIILKAEKRGESNKQLNALRESGFAPAVLYGFGIKENISLKVAQKDLKKVLSEAGESSMFVLDVDGKKYDVLIHQLAKDAFSGKITHADFYHPSAKKAIEVEVELVFEGESEAVDILGGVLIKDIQQLEIKGLPSKLPKEIIVDISKLKTFDDKILVSDLKIPEGIEILRDKDDIVATVGEVKKYEEPKEEQPVSAVEPAIQEEAEVKE